MGLKYIRFLHRAKYIIVKMLLINLGKGNCPSCLILMSKSSLPSLVTISHDVSIAMFISEVIKIMWTSSEKK